MASSDGSPESAADSPVPGQAAPTDGRPISADGRPGAWSSGLSIPGFASCLSLGMEPVGLVRGIAVMQWAWYAGSGSLMTGNTGAWGAPRWSDAPSITGGRPYQETWQCPHGFIGPEHRSYGYNVEQTWVEANWARGFNLAYGRMVDEAAALGACTT
jgi:hypothetical protein